MPIREPNEVQAALTEIKSLLFEARREGWSRSVPTEVGVQFTAAEEAVAKALEALDG